MAFQNVTFPEIKLKHGISREIVVPVSVTGNGNRELRRKMYRHERFIYTIPARTLLEADKQAIYKFFNQVNYGLDSFMFKDPTIEFNDSKLSFRSGTTWWLNLPFDSTTAGTHPVYNPKLADLWFKKNTVAVTGVTLSYDTTTGLPYVTVPGSVNTDTITVSGPVYITVRFNGTFTHTTVAMAPSTNGGTCNPVPVMVELGDISLIEVFEK